MKQSIAKFIYLASIIAAPVHARADALAQVELEVALEKRVSVFVSRFDPEAFVRVSVSYRKISSPLPGTSFEVRDYSGSGESGTLRSAGLSSVNVTIYSAKENFPKILNTEISKLIPEAPASIEVKGLTDELRLALNIQPPQSSEVVERRDESFSATSLRFGAMLLGIALLCLFVASALAFKLSKQKMFETSRLIESRLIPMLQNLGNIATEGSGSSSRPTVLQATLSAPAGGFPTANGSGSTGTPSQDVTSLKLATLESLFSDAYWSHRDGYASWLWSAMSHAQRSEIFESKKVPGTYLKAIQVFPKERSDDHVDPAYLKALPIHHLSQDDMARWVEASLPAFHLLSPMRQTTLPISLKTRLACMAEPLDLNMNLPPIPSRESPPRILHAVQPLGELSNDDETTILHNPAMVSDLIKPQIRSLVWLAIKPFEFRQNALKEFSAEELASAWAGSPEVLARLLEAIPEKKRPMLNGYIQTVAANKKAYVYTKLVDAGLSSAIVAGITVKSAA